MIHQGSVEKGDPLQPAPKLKMRFNWRVSNLLLIIISFCPIHPETGTTKVHIIDHWFTGSNGKTFLHESSGLGL